MLLLYYIHLHPGLPLVLYLSFYIMHVPYLTSFTISLPAPVCLCSRHNFQYMLFDSKLSIHVCLSIHATWHSPHHSGSSCPDPRAWSLWTLPLVDQICTAEAWIISRPSEALSFQTPFSASSFPFATRECLMYSSLLYISLYSRICVISVI